MAASSRLDDDASANYRLFGGRGVGSDLCDFGGIIFRSYVVVRDDIALEILGWAENRLWVVVIHRHRVGIEDIDLYIGRGTFYATDCRYVLESLDIGTVQIHMTVPAVVAHIGGVLEGTVRMDDYRSPLGHNCHW